MTEVQEADNQVDKFDNMVEAVANYLEVNDGMGMDYDELARGAVEAMLEARK